MATREFTSIPLHGRFDDDGERFKVYMVLNGVEVPLSYLDVASHRELYDEARSKASGESAPSGQ